MGVTLGAIGEIMIGLRHLMIGRRGDPGGEAKRLAAGRFSLGGIAVDPIRHTVSRNGDLLAVEPRVMDLLLYLSGRPGQIVSKQELKERVWRSHVVDQAVHRAMSLLRAALGDSTQRPAIIETIPRHGYRLLVRPTAAWEGKRRHLALPLAAAAAATAVGLFILTSAGLQSGTGTAQPSPSAPQAEPMAGETATGSPSVEPDSDRPSVEKQPAANPIDHREAKAPLATQPPVARPSPAYAPVAPAPEARRIDQLTATPRAISEAPRSEPPAPTPMPN